MSPSISLNVAAKVSQAVASLKSLSETAEELSRSVSRADRSTASLGRTQAKTAAQTAVAKQQMSSYSKEIDELSRAQMRAIATSGGLATANNSLAQAIDDTNLSIGRLGANIGPFSIALRSIGTQIPLLVSSLGTLAVALIGVGTAAGVAATGLAGILTGGFIQMSEQLQENMSGIEDSGEALEQIGSAVRDMFGEALGPLITQENMELTTQFLEGSAEMVNEVAAGLQQMMNMGGGVGIVPMLQQIAQTMQSELPTILDTVANNFAELQSILVGISDAFITNIAPAISFATDIIDTIAGPTSAFLAEIGDLSAELIQLGSVVSTGILPVVTTFIRQFTELVSALNAVNDEAIATLAQLVAFAGVFKVLTGLFSTVATTIQTLAGSMIAVGGAAGGAVGSFNALAGGISRTVASIVPGILEIGVATVDVVDQLGLLPSRLDDIFTRIRAGMAVSDRVEGFGDLIEEAIAGNLRELDNFDFENELNFFRSGKNLAKDFANALPSPIAGMRSLKNSVKSANFSLTSLATTALPATSQMFRNAAKDGMLLSGVLATLTAPITVLGDVAQGSANGFSSAFTRMKNSILSVTGVSGRMQEMQDMVSLTGDMGTAGFGKNINSTSDAMLHIMETSGSARESLQALAAQLIIVSKRFTLSAISAKAYAAAQYLANNGIIASLSALKTYIATQVVSIATTTALTVATMALATTLGSIAVIGMAVTGALAAVTGAVVAMGGPMEAKESILSKLTQAVGRLGMAVTKSLMPIFNSMVDTFVGIRGILSGLILPFVRLARSFGLISDGAGNSMSAMDALIKTVQLLIKPFQILWGIVGSFFRVVGGTFRAVTSMGTALIQILIGIGKYLFSLIPGFDLLVKGANLVKNAFLSIPEAIGSAFDIVKGGVEGIVNLAVGAVNKLIRAANKIPKVNIDTVDKVDFSGSQTVSAEKAEEAFQSDEDEEQSGVASETNFNANLNLNQNTEVSGTFNMAPEEEERVKRLVEDAVEDANKFRRRREGQ